jgi:hypothetical protein
LELFIFRKITEINYREGEKLKNFGFIAKMPLLGAECRDYVPVFRRYEIEVVHVIPDPALVDPYINGLLFRWRRVVVVGSVLLGRIRIHIPGIRIILPVFRGSG